VELLAYVGDRAGEIYAALAERGLLVRWWNRADLRPYLRITVGKPEDQKRLLAAIEEVW
jgi:histidinol-phosphate aminotransferase